MPAISPLATPNGLSVSGSSPRLALEWPSSLPSRETFLVGDGPTVSSLPTCWASDTVEPLDLFLLDSLDTNMAFLVLAARLLLLFFPDWRTGESLLLPSLFSLFPGWAWPSFLPFTH